LHKVLNAGLPILGMVVVFGGVVFLEDRRTMILVVLLGILLIEAGVWKLSNPFLPTERRFNELRLEVDQFMELVRELNGSAVEARGVDGDAGSWARFRNTIATMHASVERMGEAAARGPGDPPTVPPAGEEEGDDGPLLPPELLQGRNVPPA
jgi:hypothetical protein